MKRQLTDEEKLKNLLELGYSETETIFAITHEKTNDLFSRKMDMNECIGIGFFNTIKDGKEVDTIWTTPKRLLKVLEENIKELMPKHPRSN